jgi:ankyrin repeat protein
MKHDLFSDSISEVEKALEEGADINQTNSAGYTALHRAIMDGKFALARFLLDNNADNRAKEGKETPAHLAIRQGEYDLASRLITAENVDVTGYASMSLLHTAAISGQPELVETVLSRGATLTVDQWKRSPYHLAGDSGSLDTLKALPPIAETELAHEPDEDGDTILHAAAYGGHTNIIEYLLDLNFPDTANDSGSKAIDIAMRYKHWPVVETILKSSSNHPKLLLAILSDSHDSPETARRLILAGYPINEVMPTGENALILAVKGKLFDLIPTLIEHGIDIDHADNQGNTAMHYLILGFTEGHSDATREKAMNQLIDSGARVDIENQEGHTASYLELKRSKPQLFSS